MKVGFPLTNLSTLAMIQMMRQLIRILCKVVRVYCTFNTSCNNLYGGYKTAPKMFAC